MVNIAGASQPRKVFIVIDDQWHLDKRIPISLIAALLLQTAGALWWAAQVSYRLDVQDKRIEEVVRAQDRVSIERTVNLQRLTRVEQSLTDIRNFMDKVDNKLQRILEK